MPRKKYKTPEDAAITVSEPVAAYGTAVSEISVSSDWNPNVPFHGTQEEWWEHFHRIEQGEFMTIEEADEKFEIWKKKLLASRM
jgi:hypothetical protein